MSISNKSKKKKSFSIRNLFWNDRFVIIFSLVVAVIFWAAVCVSFSPETTTVVEDVPIVIDTKNSVPSQCGLQVFGDDNFTVDITVSGSRYVVGENLLSAEDFTVTALTNSVTTAGTHSLQIRVSKVNEDANFNIDSISDNYITVYFDAFDKKEMPVTVQLNKENFVKTGYMTDDNFIMDSKTVVVSGPALEIAQLDSVIADVQVPGDQLSATTTCTANLTAYTKNQTALKYVQINGIDKATMNVSIPVYRMGSQSLDVEFTNVPSGLIGKLDSFVDYSFSPSSLNIAVLQNGTQSDKLKIGTIDFSELKNGETVFKFPLKNVKSIKNDSTKVKEVTVTCNVSGISSKTLTLSIDKLSVVGVPKGKNLNFSTSYISVDVYGKKSELDKLDAENISAVIDLEDNKSAETDGLYSGPVFLKDEDACWVYGDYELSYYLT